MTLACLASQFCTELGPAQPQLVWDFLLKKKTISLHLNNFIQPSAQLDPGAKIDRQYFRLKQTALNQPNIQQSVKGIYDFS